MVEFALGMSITLYVISKVALFGFLFLVYKLLKQLVNWAMKEDE